MITIPTTELIGCLSDVLPVVVDQKESPTWGVAIAWDGESLHFTSYDIYSAASVVWTPGEGAEGETVEDEDDEEVIWGGDDAPWNTFIYVSSVKEIIKLFKLPAKLWRAPVAIKCSIGEDKLIIERIDSPAADRVLTVPGAPEVLRQIPDVRGIAANAKTDVENAGNYARFANTRLGAFGTVRLHGTMTMAFGGIDDPVGVTIGRRFAGYIYQTGARNVRPRSFLRDGAGLHVSRPEPDPENVF